MHNRGFMLFIISVILFLLDRFTHVLSSTLGKIICGDRYMQRVGGVIGDMSCGFNIDMYLAACLLILCLASGVMIFGSYLKKPNP